MKDNLKHTWKNKLVALTLLVASVVPIWLDRDATIFAMMIWVVVPLFLAKRDYVGRAQHDE